MVGKEGTVVVAAVTVVSIECFVVEVQTAITTIVTVHLLVAICLLSHVSCLVLILIGVWVLKIVVEAFVNQFLRQRVTCSPL